MGRWVLVGSLLGLNSGCAAGARMMLFTGTPAFVLTAAPERRGTLLTVSGLDPEDRADDLCGPDDGESCHDDVFVGLLFYRSDTGAYGDYVELGQVLEESEWFDPAPPGPDTAWRAATVRQELDAEGAALEPYVDEVSTAAGFWVEASAPAE
jgi:hypothetical protein